jgi:hypothetical protein
MEPQQNQEKIHRSTCISRRRKIITLESGRLLALRRGLWITTATSSVCTCDFVTKEPENIYAWRYKLKCCREITVLAQDLTHVPIDK